MYSGTLRVREKEIKRIGYLLELNNREHNLVLSSEFRTKILGVAFVPFLISSFVIFLGLMLQLVLKDL
jgi:hypothetical protein